MPSDPGRAIRAVRLPRIGPRGLLWPWIEVGPLRNRTAAGASAAGGREILRKSVVRYFVNLKFAWWLVPSMNFTVSVRHVLTHNLSVFQT